MSVEISPVTAESLRALLNDLYVVPASRGGRGSGVGHALLTAAAEYAAKAGFEVLSWETAPDNTTAQALYDRFLAAAGQPDGVSVWKSYSYRLNGR